MFIVTIMPFLVVIVIILLISIRQVNQYERGIKFTFGKYTSMAEPGWRLVIPIFQSMTKVDIRTKAVDVPDQDALTKDNISIRINAVIYYKVLDSAKAILEVENFYYAVSQLAQTTMRNVVGEIELDNLLQNRDEVSGKISSIIEKAAVSWGIDVQTVELKDVVLPNELKRVISQQAEAEREKRAVIIKAEGEVLAAENMAKAARTLAAAPGALHLRTLQSINDMSSDQSNTTVWMMPLEVLRAVEAIADTLKAKK